MADTEKLNGGAAMKVAELLREPIEAAQARFGRMEEEAQRVLKDVVDRSRAGRKDLENLVHKLATQDWSQMTQRLDRLRDQGVERATEWRERAGTFRAETLERMVELQGRAIAFLGVATREQVEELSKEIERLSRKIAKADRARRGRKGRPAPAGA